MKNIIQKLSLIVKLVTVKDPMRTLLWMKLLREQILIVHHPCFFVHGPNKTMKLGTGTLDCDIIPVNQENDSVLNSVRSWISKSKLPTKDVQSRQCKGLHGYVNQFEKLFVDKETQIVCRKSKQPRKQICLSRNFFFEAFNAANDYRLSGHPGSKNLFYLWIDFYKGLECANGYLL